MNDFLKVIVYGGLFVVPFLTLYVANDYFFPYITGKNFAFRIIVELVFVSWILLALSEVKYRPKFSWILSSFSVLLIVMFFANLFGEHPRSSFWSNFERMDGYVTLVHVFLYTTVLGSVLINKKLWGYFLHATVTAAFIMSFYGLSQYASGETARIESFLGNSAYLAIYLLFHTFIAFWLFVESKVNLHRAIYAALALMFIFTLIETGTRGTVIGLGVGISVMVAYIALFGAQYQQYRRFAIGAFVLLLVLVGAFVVNKDSAFIQDNSNLARVANIDLGEDLKIRGVIWGMAWEGVKERPVLGWGQSNFNYVFNKNYDSRLYGQEQWFDRVHNIFFDWLIAGGFLGLIAYLSIFVSALYYLFILPLWKKDDETFTVLERAVLLGILVGYFTHNLVVFDNIVSYIFFAVILALIHSRVGVVIPKVESFKIDKQLFTQFAVPVAVVVVAGVIYTAHIPGMNAASDIIDGYRAATPTERFDAFERAIERDSFAQQEITEQLAQQAMSMVRDSKIPEDIRQKFIVRSEIELERLVEEKPGDARIHVFFGSYYRALNNLDAATEQMAIARSLSPNKQSIISQQAIVAYSQGELGEAKELFEESFLLDESNLEAREFYAALLFRTGESEKAKGLADSEIIINRFANNEFLLAAANDAKETAFMIELYEARVAQKPKDDQGWVSLSFLHYQAEEIEKAVETLERASQAIPSFEKTATCFAENIKAGKEPQEGC
jgi:O-antigen ligase/cytochrome c-type biogenesis protein CcmH/NrfG